MKKNYNLSIFATPIIEMDMRKLLKDAFFLIVLFIFSGNLYSQKEHKKEIDSLTRSIEQNYIDGRFNQHILLKNITELYYLSKENGFAKEQLFSIFEEAKIYFINGNLIKSLSKIKEGIYLAEKQKDNNMLCHFLLLYQRLVLELDHLNLSKKVLAQAEKYNMSVPSEADRNVNEIWILLAKADLLAYSEEKVDQVKVVNLKKQAYQLTKNIPQANTFKKLSEIFSLLSLTWSQTFLPNIDEAEKNEAIIDGYLKNYPSEALIILNLMIKGKIANTKKNYPLAIEYYNQAIEKSKKTDNFPRLFKIYPLLSDSYEGLKDYEKATYYSNEFKQLVDSVDVIKKKSGDLGSISEINSEILDKKTGPNYRYIFSGLAILIVLGVVGVFIYRKRSKDFSQNIDKPDTESILSGEQQEKYSYSESKKTKELIHLAKEDINAFYIEFQKVYPTFYKSLQEQYPELNISDINFCSLIKMNFGIKEISQYTNSSIRAAEARRYRINKKMNLKSQNELYIILSMIS
ncbi:hypothetical protein ATE47_14875 [Chryseobacterium sp. IHB B 17019]|uniref:hypothetical protein n=1 Tax=Chryseobacterium sp. IHB B 17019 TaxID=1721091 RepID=UPI00072063F1|nr:hypothetical protein [Chryseobacterium sp. IHB B 17019]ALR31714.1 hypothetical protein ATE47_14875 [Chryseobacterium sp. IHB B 17019]